METKIHSDIKINPEVLAAKDIINRCVHCGFCNATCPTYQLTGDENDGPRGRIYQIKTMLETNQATKENRFHLERCLLCRSCETTCPSGVDYSKLYQAGIHFLNTKHPQHIIEKQKRQVLQAVLINKSILNTLLLGSKVIKPLLPESIKNQLPRTVAIQKAPINTRHSRRMVLFQGCVQNSIDPNIDESSIAVFDKLGIYLEKIKQTSCCGALSYHNNDTSKALKLMKNNIDVLWNEVSHGAEAFISNTSGCGSFLKEYDYYFKDDPEYAKKATIITTMTKDISEIIANENLSAFQVEKETKVAWHPPCSLQHGQKNTNLVETILTDCGYTLLPVFDSHMCCGSAGSYSIFQPELSAQLKHNKLYHLNQYSPDIIATANIGCQMHLQSGSNISITHWINLLYNLIH